MRLKSDLSFETPAVAFRSSRDIPYRGASATVF